MIQNTTLRTLRLALAFLILGSATVLTHSAAAEQADMATGAYPGAYPGSYGDTTQSATGVAVGTAVGSKSDETYPSPQVVEEAKAGSKLASLKEAAKKFFRYISKTPTGRELRADNGEQRPAWKIEQDNAANAARNGDYATALPILDRLHKEHPEDLSIAIDNAAILAWAGHDVDAVAAYRALPAGERPDYLIDAIGHAYRNLKQPDEALVVYRQGLQTSPANQSFLAGEIFSLLESDHVDEAVASAQSASNKYQTPEEPLALAIKQAFHVNAIDLARKGMYKDSLAALENLHRQYPDDTGIAGDYVAVLSWAGHDTEAVSVYRTLASDDLPDYVLDAVAHSYRNLRQPQQAYALYKAALEKNPDNVVYAVGAIYSLSDMGRSSEAYELAKAQMAKHPEKPAELVKAYMYVERHRAIELARAGKFEQALTLLRQLRSKYTGDASLTMDYIAVLSWAGHHEEAVKEYQRVARQPMQDYVLSAVGASYRALGQPEKALAVYRRGLKQSPASAVFAAGEIRCLDDLNRYDEGVERAKAFTKAHGEHLDVLLAGGEAANFGDQSVEAMNFYERAGTLAPRNTEALRGLVRAENRAGAPHLALRTAASRPGLMTAAETREIVGTANAAMVRWGPMEPYNEAARFQQTDEALASIDAAVAKWSGENDPDAYPDIMRARFDRLTALRDRVRMQDVVNDYNELVQSGVEIPAFALVAVGDAYLYLRQPEIARDIFLKVLETSPKNFEARRLLAYAYLECNQYDEAFTTVDKLRTDEPQWIYLKGQPERQPNPNRATVEVDAGAIRSYAGLQKEADERLTPVTDAGPFDARNRAAAGNLAMARGWPRKALDHYMIGVNIQDGRDVANETGMAMANMELQNYREAEKWVQSLAQRFPENQGVQRAAREWEVHNMAELDVHAGYDFAPSQDKDTNGNSPKGQGYNMGAEIYSAPINYDWRVFAGQDYWHQRQPGGEGIVDYARSNLGAEYRRGDVTASVAPTVNAYNNRTRLGAEGNFKYTFNDLWTGSIGAALFSANTPLRALNAGITANEYDGRLVWRQSESRQVAFDASVMTFSDTNTRTSEGVDYTERFYDAPNLKLDAEVALTSTQNSATNDRPYYNPQVDLLALAGVRATHTLYQRYETLYQHSLLLMPGFYTQKNYGTSPAWVVRYEHRLHYNDTLNAGVGVNYARQDFDGVSSDAVSITMDVVERF